MSTAPGAPAVTATPPPDDERALLTRFELLLEREEEALLAHDAAAIAAASEERMVLTERLTEVARVRRAGQMRDASEEAGLLELYRRLRQRHDVRSQVIRRHAEHNSRAIGVLAQASGGTGLYRADGTVALQFAAI